MPTFRNDTTVTKRAIDHVGRKLTILPGKSITSYFDLAVDGFTKTADTPYFNPIEIATAMTFSSANDDKTVYLSKHTNKLRIVGIVGSITVDLYLESINNTPPVLEKVSSTSPLYEVFTKKLATVAIVRPSGAGSCVLQEVKF